MSETMETNQTRDKLSKEDKDLLDLFGNTLRKNSKMVDDACYYLAGRVGDDICGHLVFLSPDIKIQACLDHLAIGLISGDVKQSHLKKMIDEGIL